MKDKSQVSSPVKKLQSTKTQTMKRLAEHTKDKKMNLSNSDLSSFDFNELFDYEYLYMRNSDLATMNLIVSFPVLRVLDLSSNQIENLSFLSNMPSLKHVFLSSNRVDSFFELPYLSSLESLNMSSNSISSFTGFISLPKLRVLNLDTNNIGNYKDFPYLPQLEIMNLEGNQLCDMKDFREITYGMNLKLEKLNHQALSESEKNKGFRYRGSVAISAREGLFILKDEPDVDVRQKADEHFKNIQRVRTMHTPLHLIQLSLVGEAKENISSYIVPVFRVEQDVVVQGPESLVLHTFSVEANETASLLIDNWSPISLDKKFDHLHFVTLLLPAGTYNVKYVVDGSESEPSTVFVKGTDHHNDATDNKKQLHTCVRWYKSSNGVSYSKIENACSLHYVPSFDDFGSSLKVEFSAYNDANGEDELFTIYDFSEDKVQFGDPACISLEIEGNVVEGEILRAKAVYTGGKQGDCIYKWYGPNDKVVEGQSYELSIDDIGSKITLEFTPVRKDGLVGQPTCAMSEVVIAATPEVENLIIAGELVEEGTITVDYDYYGGIEGASIIQWFRSTDAEFQQFEPIEGATDKELFLTLDHVGRVLRVEITPVDTEGVIGVVSHKITDVVSPSEPRLGELSIEASTFVQGVTIQLNCQYCGGFEGPSRVEWYRVTQEGEKTLIKNTHDHTYTLAFEDIGHYIEVTKTPVSKKGVAGKPKNIKSEETVSASLPKIVSLSLSGSLVEDQILTLQVEYMGGLEGQSIIEWFRTTEEADELIEEATGKFEIRLGLQDLSKQIKVRYTPIRSDGVCGEPVEFTTDIVQAASPILSNVQLHAVNAREEEVAYGSAVFYGGVQLSRNHKWIRIDVNDEQTVIEGATQDVYTFTAADVDHRIIYGVQAVREDLTTDWVLSTPSDVIVARRPEISKFNIVGEFVQDGTLRAEISGSYYSLEKSRFRWVRVDMDGIETPLTEESIYNIVDADMGCSLRCYFTAVRGDYEIEADEVSATTAIISAGDPTARSCKLQGESEEAKELVADVEYYGGVEGSSTLYWYRIRDDEQCLIESASGQKTYTLTAADVGYSIHFEYTPIRDDGVIGATVSDTIASPVVAAFPKIISLEITGDVIEDSKLVAKAVYFGGVEGVSMKRWKRMDGVNNPTVSIETCEYTITKQDIGFPICFEYTPIRNDSVKGKVVKSETLPVQAKPPSVSNVRISGTGIVSSELTVSGTYYGGIEGSSEFVWIASEKRDGIFTPIPGNGNKLIVSHEHVGLFIKAQYTPVRSDGEKGTTVESNTAVKVLLDPEFKKILATGLSKGSLDMEGLKDSNNNPVTLEFNNTRTILKNTDNKKAIVRSRFVDPLQKLFCPMTQDATNETSITFTCKKGTWALTASTSKQRDNIMLAYRFFLGLARDDVCKDLLGAAFCTAWKKKKSGLEMTDSGSNDIPASATTQELQKACKVIIAFRSS